MKHLTLHPASPLLPGTSACALTRSPLEMMKTNPISRLIALLSCAAAALFTVPAVTHAGDPPGKITYQGFLTDAEGTPLGNSGAVSKTVKFRIWDHATDSEDVNLKWSEQQSVAIDKGHFSVLLGEGSSVSGESHKFMADLRTVFAEGGDRYLELHVDGKTLLPRLHFLPAPFAVLAYRARGLTDASGAQRVFVGANGLGIGVATPDHALHVSGDVVATSFSGAGSGITGINGNHITSGTIGNATLATDAVTKSKIAADAVGTEEIIDGTIATADIANGAVTGAKLATDAVTKSKIAADAVGKDEIAVDAVGQSEIRNSAVGTGEIINGTVATVDLADGAVTGDKLDLTGYSKRLDIGTGVGNASMRIWSSSYVNGTDAVSGALVIQNDLSSTIQIDSNDIQRTFNGDPSTLKLNAYGGRVEIGNRSIENERLLRLQAGGSYWDIGLDDEAGTSDDDLTFFYNGVEKGWLDPTSASWDNPSDRRLKFDIEPLAEGILDSLKRFGPVRFRWKDQGADAELQIGFIAQDVQAVYPSLVSEEGGTLGLSYGTMSAVAIGAVKELDARTTTEVTALRQENAALKQQLADLLARVRALESKAQ